MKSVKIPHLFTLGLLLWLGSFDTLTAQTVTFQASPSQLTFAIPQAGVMPVLNYSQFSIATSATGSSVPYAITGPSWLDVTPASGTATNSAQIVTATLNSTASTLQNGIYSGTITITQSNGTSVAPLAVKVQLTVGNQLTLSQSAITMVYQIGQAAPSASVNVGSTGAALPYSVTSIVPAQSWLLPSVTPGATTPGPVSISINPAGLAAGTYDGSFRVVSTSSGVSGQDVTVKLTVTQTPTLTASPQQLSFVYQTGTSSGALPSRSITLATTGGPVAFTLDAISQTWLSLTANGTVASQNQPVTLTVTVNPNSPAVLPAGSYSANIVARPVGGDSSSVVTIPVSLLVSSKPLFSVGTPPVPFNYQLNGPVPADQTVSIGTSSTSLDYTVTDKPDWLEVLPGAGSTSLVQSLTLHPLPNVLAVKGTGTYTGSVTISVPQAGNPTITIPVTLNVTFVPTLTTTVGGLTFNYQTTSSLLPGQQYFTVNSTGGASLAINNPAVATTACGGNWLSATSSGNTTGATIFVSVAPTGINQPASCTGTVTITSSSATGPLVVPVTLNVSANPLLNVSAPDMTFVAAFGTATAQQRTISVSSTDPNAALNYTIVSDSPWLTPSIPNGRTDQQPSFTVYVNPGGFPQAGTYTGSLTITNQSANPAGSQPGQVVRVTLTVTSSVTLSVTPAQLNFTIPSGGTAATQTLQVGVSSGTAPINASAATNQGGNWLKVAVGSQAAGLTAGGTAPLALTVTADPASLGLAPGDYTGFVTVSSQGLQNSPVTVSVKLTVGTIQTLSFSQPSITFNTTLGATANLTAIVNLLVSSGSTAFTVAKGATGCNALTVSPVTGNVTTSGVPLTLTLNPTGLTTGTSTCLLTAAGPTGSGIANQTFTVNVNVAAAAIPSITAVKNAASYASGAIAPGELIVIGGTNLGPADLAGYVLTNGNTSFSTTVAGTMVYFDSVPGPIVYTRADIVAVVVPFEVAGRPTVNVTVQRFGQTSPPLTLQVASAAPGLFTSNQQGTGQGAILNQDGVTANSATAPAAKGSVVAIYFTGAGLLSHANTTGGMNPLSPLATIQAPVTVTVAGQTAQVQFQGGAPNAIAGLYQVNATIPAGAPSGPQSLTVTVGGQPAQGAVTVFVQ